MSNERFDGAYRNLDDIPRVPKRDGATRIPDELLELPLKEHLNANVVVFRAQFKALRLRNLFFSHSGGIPWSIVFQVGSLETLVEIADKLPPDQIFDPSELFRNR